MSESKLRSQSMDFAVQIINLLKSLTVNSPTNKNLVKECDSVKNVVISADGDRKVYSVPDVVADNLSKYCIEFCTKWIRNSPQAKKYRIRGGVCYNEDDFIEYLNTYVFPNEKSVLVKI